MKLSALYNACPKIRDCAPPPEKIEAKSMQNFDRFYTVLDLGREYLRNESRYPKLERYVIENDSSAFGEKVR